MADCVAAQIAREAVERGTHTRSKLGRGAAGRNISNPSDSRTTSTSNNSHESNGTHSLKHLPWLSGKRGFREILMDSWLRTQSEVPSSIFQRPFENMDTPSQSLTKMANLHGFYNESLGCSKTKTHQRNTKQQSPCLLCPQSTNETPQNLNEQPSNLSHSESSLQCNPASTSRYINPNNAGPTSSDFATSVSSVVARNSTMTTQN